MMFSIKHAISAVAFFVAMQTGAMAAEKCYEETPVPASVTCNASDSKSADFVSGCKSNAATLIKKEITCPAAWVNADGKSSQASVCTAAGMTSTTIDGSRCAAGERRPSGGANAGSINYRFGKWGSGGGSGGSTVEMRSRSTSSQTITYYYCWNPGNKRDYDGTDIAVAYACKP